MRKKPQGKNIMAYPIA